MKNGERARAGHGSPAAPGPTAGPGPAPAPGPTVVGREAEVAEIRSRIAADRSHSSVLIVEGDPGAGKSVLLDLAVRLTRGTGQRVLRAVGSESEAPLAFAGLHQMLRPVLDYLGGLPPASAPRSEPPWDWPKTPKTPKPPKPPIPTPCSSAWPC